MRFPHVFFSLLVLAFLSGFVISPRIGDRARAGVQNIFKPVSWPVDRIGGAIHDRLVTQKVRDDGSPNAPRSAAVVIQENTLLRQQIAVMTAELTRLREKSAELDRLGDLGRSCTSVSVIGTDSGPRDGLLLGGGTNLRENMPVLVGRQVIGKIARTGVGGTHVLLLTDTQSRFTVSFSFFEKQVKGPPILKPRSADHILVEGAGRGRMTARVTESQAKEIELHLDDWAVIADRDSFPAAVDGAMIGRIESIEPSNSPGFVDIRITPEIDTMTLREVLVLNK